MLLKMFAFRWRTAVKNESNHSALRAGGTYIRRREVPASSKR